MAPIRPVQVARYRGAGVSTVADAVVREEPLEIRLAGDTLAITMRTPGADRELVLGFLWAEGVITALADVAAIESCRTTGPAKADRAMADSPMADGATADNGAMDDTRDDDTFYNCIDVTPSDRMRLTLAANIGLRRGTLTTSACGVCGRRTIDDLLARCAPLSSTTTMTAAALTRGTQQLRLAQPIFARTGGCHGAALVDRHGDLIAAYEDVGRHNAVDKLIGARLLAGAMPAGHDGGALIVSGRTSFEIVQKAVAAGIAIVAGISAASSLAIDTAQRAGVTLAGFVRNAELVIYTHPERIHVERPHVERKGAGGTDAGPE